MDSSRSSESVLWLTNKANKTAPSWVWWANSNPAHKHDSHNSAVVSRWPFSFVNQWLHWWKLQLISRLERLLICFLCALLEDGSQRESIKTVYMLAQTRKHLLSDDEDLIEPKRRFLLIFGKGRDTQMAFNDDRLLRLTLRCFLFFSLNEHQAGSDDKRFDSFNQFALQFVPFDQNKTQSKQLFFACWACWSDNQKQIFSVSHQPTEREGEKLYKFAITSENHKLKCRRKWSREIVKVHLRH